MRFVAFLAVSAPPGSAALLEDSATATIPCMGDQDQDTGVFLQAAPRPLAVSLEARKAEHQAGDAAMSSAALNVEMYRAYVEVELARGTQDMEPMMDKSEVAFLGRTLDGAESYLEFGMGGSTIFALQHANIKCLKSVESSVEWVEKVSEEPGVSSAIKAGRLVLEHADIGPTKAFGYPADPKTEHKWPSYSQQTIGCDGCPSNTTGGHNVVLVDGRFRVACFLHILAAVNDEDRELTTLLVHDYDRQDYHVVEEFVEVIERVNRLAAFQRKAGVDNKRVQELAKQYEKNQL